MVSIRRSEEELARIGGRSYRYPWERTGSVDVELLAQWAYGQQMVDRFERAGLHAIEAEASGFEVSGYSADGVGQLMQIEHLGCRIDRSSVSVRDTVHAAAYAVAQALMGAAHGDRVRFHARAGTRPRAWMAPDHKARAAVWVKPWEVAQVEYQGPGRKGGYCQVILTWDARREAWGRDDYRAWWQGLADLAWALSTRAMGFVVTGPAAPSAPWCDCDEVATGFSSGAASLNESIEASNLNDPPSGSSQRRAE